MTDHASLLLKRSAVSAKKRKLMHNRNTVTSDPEMLDLDKVISETWRVVLSLHQSQDMMGLSENSRHVTNDCMKHNSGSNTRQDKDKSCWTGCPKVGDSFGKTKDISKDIFYLYILSNDPNITLVKINSFGINLFMEVH